ncbi:MAG: flagellar protein FlaG [Pseudomonadales bacterium]|nr:flagellar protein FlaG [Pseudomonadales bacterium]
MNDLNIGSAYRPKVSADNYSSNATSPAAGSQELPPKQAQAIPSGNALPTSIKSVAENTDANTRVKTTPVEQRETKKIDRAEAGKAVEDLNKVAVSLHRDLNFKVDEDTGQSIITVIDTATQEVIRQIPSEEIVELAKKLQSLVHAVPTSGGDTKTDAATGALLNITV